VYSIWKKWEKRGGKKKDGRRKEMDECHFIMTNVSILEQNKLFLDF
jgi:hypothetical protein